MPALTAGASLLIDYTLTVAVSVSAGVAAITSALPVLHQFRVLLCLGFVGLIILGNLRGLRESGSIFAVPTYLFIISVGVLVALGVFHALTGTDTPINAPRESVTAIEGVSVWLILKAFTAGCTALTGVEAISDGVPAFKKPESRNAATTLTVMCVILGAMFIGLSFLAHRYGIVPHAEETVISQIARALIGHGFAYYFIQAMTALILVLAANTSFADFPRLSTWLARDHYMPHQFLFRGDRLAYNTGISVLGVLASILIIVFQRRNRPAAAALRGGRLHGVHAVAGRHGAALVPGARQRLDAPVPAQPRGGDGDLFRADPRGRDEVHRRRMARARAHALRHPAVPGDPQALYPACSMRSPSRTRTHPCPRMGASRSCSCLWATMNKMTLHALRYARSIAGRVVAVHVTDDAEEAELLQAKWEKYGEGVNLVILESPYRSLAAPLLSYIDLVQKKRPHDLITVVVPEYVPDHWWAQALHSQTALRLKAALLFRDNTVVTSVPYHEDAADPIMPRR